MQGKDGINISYIRKGGKELVERIVKIVQMIIIESLAERWEESLRVGIIVSLFMKGAKGMLIIIGEFVC